MTKQDLQKVAVYESLLLKFKDYMSVSDALDFAETWNYFDKRSTEYSRASKKAKAKIKEKRKSNPDYARPEREWRKKK